jgi:hypothetical protein
MFDERDMRFEEMIQQNEKKTTKNKVNFFHSITFNNPATTCTPSGTNSDKCNWKWFVHLIGQKSCSFSFFADRNNLKHNEYRLKQKKQIKQFCFSYIILPSNPKASVFTGTQNIGCVIFSNVWFGTVLAND